MSVILPLFVGLILYIWLRPDALITQIIVKTLPNIKIIVYKGNSPIIVGIRNHVSDFLWAYSFMMCIWGVSATYKLDPQKGIIICLIVCYLMELSQVINTYFTFDVLDLVAESVGVLLAYFVGKRIINPFLRRNKYE